MNLMQTILKDESKNELTDVLAYQIFDARVKVLKILKFWKLRLNGKILHEIHLNCLACSSPHPSYFRCATVQMCP
jgi:hypothetical protein